MKALVITGAGTEIGKTYVSCGLIRAFRARGEKIDALKPIVSGFTDDNESDPARLLTALGVEKTPATLARITPYRYAAPLAPNLAARLEGKAVDYAAILAACRDAIAAAQGTLIIEGAGGLMSPLSDDRTFLDLIADLAAPTLIVGGSYLGAISHMLTTVEAARARNVAVVAGVISESAPPEAGLAETHEMLTRLDPRTRYFPLARGDNAAFAPLLAALS